MSIKPTMKAVALDDVSPLLLGLIGEGYDVTFTVVGDSMSPLWCNMRDSVVLTKCDPSSLKVGDVPLCKRPNGKYVLHRIIKVNDETYDIIGDNQTEIEKGLPKSCVLCVVKSFNRKGKAYSCNTASYKLYTFLILRMRGLCRFSMKFAWKVKNLLKGGKK